MAGMIEQLLELMNEQASRYEDLLGLSKEKRGVIIANDIEGLQKITHLENILVSQNQKLEKKRQGVIRDISQVMGKDETEMTLGALIGLMEGQAEQADLIKTGNRIRETLNELSELNGCNASLVDNALDYIEYSLNLIRSAVEQDPGVYSPKGEQPRNETNIFDAKH
ncbi:MAG: flagellar protein FlgN [Defluviitaleaceae bacterium]|nr:flagellar protein FlgN [Defluviitaleaceae bacterium]